MTSLEFWLGVISVISVQIVAIYTSYQTRKAGAPLSKAQAQEALSEAWERVAQEYNRLLDNYKAQEDELTALRPLTLKVAMQEQAMRQTEEDKADWKRYAEKLSHQLEEHNIIPIAFRRLPSNGDSDKMKAITREQIESVVK
jgi:hypothetical protein